MRIFLSAISVRCCTSKQGEIEVVRSSYLYFESWRRAGFEWRRQRRPVSQPLLFWHRISLFGSPLV